MSDVLSGPLTAPSGARIAADLTRGVCRHLIEAGYGTLTELPLGNGRRVDVIGLGAGGDFVIVEVKSSPADFRADRKWRDYLPYCDRFFFAVAPGFPADLLPGGECGVLVADRFNAAISRAAPPRRMNPARKRHLLRRFGHAASTRLGRAIGLAGPAP